MVMTSLGVELFSVSTALVKEKHKRDKGKPNFFSCLLLIYFLCTHSLKLGIFSNCHPMLESIYAFFKGL